MCDEFDYIRYEDVEKSMSEYYQGREKQTTKHYFRYQGKLYPTMNIVKVAIENNSDIINDRLYDNLSCCKNTIKQLVDDEIIFYTLEENI